MPFPFLLPTEKQGRGAAHGTGPGEGEKGERASGNLFPTSIWAGAQREGRSTAVGGDGHGGSGSGARGREVLGWAALRVVVAFAELGGGAGASL